MERPVHFNCDGSASNSQLPISKTSCIALAAIFSLDLAALAAALLALCLFLECLGEVDSSPG